MTIGASVFCLVAGAILTFAVETDSTEGINVNNVGIILMVVGVIGLIAYAMIWGPRTRRVAPTLQVVDDRRVVQPVVQQPVVQQRVVREQVVQPVATTTPVVERRVYES
jgi:hypothetical protein